MAEKCSERRVKLATAQKLLNELIQLNETASRTETQMIAAGVTAAADIEATQDLMLPGGGPPQDGGDFGEADGDTISGRLYNLLNYAVSGGVDWTAEAESA
ncbi:hypothetical protein HN911_00825 [Candidatus Bathyarchaeota archaeon]|jgi:hypothetical protein|nr:hypothetical protein [Candidatus Bathyarchaeota archaeon]